MKKSVKVQLPKELREGPMRDSAEELQEQNPDAMLAVGFEKAYLGYAQQFTKPPLAVYDYQVCIEVLIDQGMGQEEAVEFFSYNVEGAWVGEGTPLIFHRK